MEQGTEKETYLALLEDSLEKKCDILESLLLLSTEQASLFHEDEISEEKFNHIVEEKDKLIQSINQLDEGFEQCYQRVKDEISIHPKKYQNEIMKLQALITSATDKSIQLQVLEKRNKSTIEDYFRKRRMDIKNFKMNNQLATNYYKNMADQHQQQAYFFDKKK